MRTVDTPTETMRTETLWAFLHEELDAVSQDAFARAVAADPALRAEVEACRRLDTLLRESLRGAASPEPGDEACADQAMRAWEAEQAGALPAYLPRMGRTLRFPGLAAPGWKAVLATAGLAAVLALLFLPYAGDLPTPGWTPPEFVPLAVRDARNPAGQKRLAPDAASRCQVALSAALQDALANRPEALPPGVVFSLRLHELPDGALSVSVRASDGNARLIGDWSGHYSSIDHFIALVGASAERMADDLSPKPDENGMPKGAP